MSGFQGYVTSRPFQGQRVPQHVQNLVIRDYCQARDMTYLLSGTEYAMPGSSLMLKKLLDGLELLDGIVLYSLFQLPDSPQVRQEIFLKVLTQKKSLHFAVETLILQDENDCQRLEDIWGVFQVMRHIPNVQEMI
tara:strand:+ start:316 stop:720 length:405 start_codon:yes stop_codon:yes gene_type:complete